MLAIRFDEEGQPPSVSEVEKPTPGPSEVLVEMHAASICGSEVHLLKGSMAPGNPPITIGHEGSGVVAETGEAVTNVDVGDHVIPNYILSCGNCRQCLQGYDNRCRERESLGHSVDGTFAEYLVVPERCAVPLDENVPLEWGSIAGCAVSTAFHAIERSEMDAGDTVTVFGVGGVGIHAVMWADFLGAGTVIATDLNGANLEAAEAYGADITVNGHEENVLEVVDRETGGWGTDIAIECSGAAAAMEQAVESIRANTRFESGNVVSVGIQEAPLKAEYYGLREGIITVSGDHTRYDLHRIVRLLESGAVDLSDSVTHRITLHDIDKGLRLMKQTDERVGRIVIDMTEV